MITRTRQKTWNFSKPFRLEGVDHALPAGGYQVTTDEELIESLSFPVYRRVRTTIQVRGKAGASSIEVFNIDPADLQAAHDNDVSGATPSSDNTTRARRAGKIHGVLLVSMVTALLFFSHAAFALYAEVKPASKVGADCIGQVSLLAPKLRTCAIAEKTMRIWCPNGQMFEGAAEQDRPQAALARSLCNMTQVP